MGKQTTARLDKRNGNISLQQHEYDSPVLPVVQLEQLNQFKPEAIDWVIQQTQIEAEFRRSETAKINLFTFIERIVGQLFALLIGLSGILGGSYVALHGQPAAGGTIASIAITGLAAVFLTSRSKK